jgi:DNA methylase/ParB-like nuclease domain
MPRTKTAPIPITPKAPDVRFVPIDTLHPDPQNVRVHPEKNLHAIRDSLTAFGQQKPLVVTPDGLILAGNGTWTAARQLGWTHIAAQVTTLAPALARAYALADNRTGELAGWDDAGLADLLRDLQAQELPLPGWDADDLAPLLTPPSGEIVEGDADPDRGAELRDTYGVEPGQLWQCGVHRLLCADSLIAANVERLLAGESPQMVWADPPYGLNIVAVNGYVRGGEAYNIPFGGVKGRPRGHVGGGESYKAKHGEYAITRDTRRGTVGAAKPFGSQKVRGTVGTHSPNIVDVGKYAPVIGDESPQTARQAATLYLGTYPAAVHIWWGANFYMDALTCSPCWLIWNKESTGNFADAELAWTNQQKAARLLTHRWNGMLRASEHERRWHPTQKPAALAAWAYGLLGKDGDLVLDPFLGCGPSLMAAAQTGRRCYGLELSPEYIAVAMHRWAVLTGETPVRVED